jgi:hypothetical protein
MKNIQISIITLIAIFLVSCNDDYLERTPKDQISNSSFWKAESDLEAYCNGLYPMLPEIPGTNGVADDNSDDFVPFSLNLYGIGMNVIPTNANEDGGWKWENVRACNVFMDNYKNADCSDDLKNQYRGEVCFFRAYSYFVKVKKYGEVPWMDHELQTNDPLLYAAKSPRDTVVAHIMKDLDFAIAHCKNKEDANYRISREIALALKARIALHEGTFRKYHGLGGADDFLNEAANASDILINEGKYNLYSTGNPGNDYFSLFSKDNAYDTPECILARQYTSSLKMHGVTHNLINSSGAGTGVSKAMFDSYLGRDGKPMSQTRASYEEEDYYTQIKNRDPRMSQIIGVPGFVWSKNWWEGDGLKLGDPIVGKIAKGSSTGYGPFKYLVLDDWDGQVGHSSKNDYLILRFAEMLLINAEAKAELGQCTQDVIDRTINRIRDRVGMPHMIIAGLVKDSKSEFAQAGIQLPVLIEEIRRERRVELLGEGFRYDDIMRWKAGKLFLLKSTVLGAKAKTIGSLASQIATGDIRVNSDGYIEPYQQALPNGRQFDETKNYYWPIPTDELALNPNLTQSPGWEN